MALLVDTDDGGAIIDNVARIGQSEPTPTAAPVGRSVHRMGWMIRLFFIHLFTLC
jgi:hypothetical protein